MQEITQTDFLKTKTNRLTNVKSSSERKSSNMTRTRGDSHPAALMGEESRLGHENSQVEKCLQD